MEHHADGPVAALGERTPRVLEPFEREVVRHEGRHVDLALREQLERAARDALRVRERAEDVQIPSDHERHPPGTERPRELRRAQTDRAWADDDDVFSGCEPAALVGAPAATEI